MAVNLPFFRCVRPGVDGDYSEGGRWMYVTHPKYAPDATHYLRAFSILQGDLLKLFESIEPADANEGAYSYRCMELLVRSCGEIEAHCRAILGANGYAASGRLTMNDYRKLNSTHRLSSYRIRLPVWTGANAVRNPFAAWDDAMKNPAWFEAHHGLKHNRYSEFPGANLGHVVDAVAGVVALLAAQFITHDFGPMSLGLSIEGSDDYEDAIGGYFRVRFPTDWPEDQRYAFDWSILKTNANPFGQLAF